MKQKNIKKKEFAYNAPIESLHLSQRPYNVLTEDKTDIEVKSLLSEKNYDRFDWGSRIYESTGKVFFRPMTAGDEE